ncbi:zinc finger CCCH domain-containing protein 13, partial [Elysia marginata]
MAADDAKLKLLPRHLQRSQPAVSKSKRRVTVEDDNAADEESDRRSVFERLGPGGLQRHELVPFDKVKVLLVGKALLINTSFGMEIGTGRAGRKPELEGILKPKLDYGQGMKGRSKNEGEKSPDNLRLKFKGSKDRETKVRSQVVPLVVKKAADGGSEEDSADESDNWSIDNLEDKKERELEQKRQEIQRALKALEDGDDAPMIDVKKSDSSGSESSPERLHKKKKDKQGKKKEKKRHKKAATEKEMSLERQGKRKHGSDEEESSPHKKKKKKNKERKHVEETAPPPPPPPLMSLDVRKQPTPKSSKGEPQPHLYEPDSPTSTHRSDSPDEKAKSKKKKKKAKMQAEAVPQGKSKKLLSPLKKVLKLKKGPASVSSSKRSRSESRDSLKRKRSRSSSNSSTDSSSHSPVAKRKERDLSGDDRRERGRVKSKSLERKKRRKQPSNQQQQQHQRHSSPRQSQQQQQQQHHHHHHRSASSSSSSSSSTTSSTARGIDRRHSKGQVSRGRGAEGQLGHQQQQRHKRSRSPAVASGGAAGSRKDGRLVKRRADASAESWNRSKDRKVTGRGESPQRQHRQERPDRPDRADGGGDGPDRGRQRHRNVPPEEVKGHRNLSQPVSRHMNDSKDRSGSQLGPKDRLRRGQDPSHDRNQKDGRDRDKDDRKGRKDESRERPGAMGGQNKEREHMEDRGRRIMGASGGPGPHMGERGGRMLHRRGNSADRDRRNFGGGGDNSGRMGQFSRQDLIRGPMGGRMGHNWDDRDGRRGGGGDWDSGREMRGFGGHRDEPMGFGKRRDGGPDERMLPHPGRGGPPRSGSQDRLISRGGQGPRDEFGGPGRDRRAGSQEADNSRRDRDSSRGGRDDSRGGRGARDEGGKSRGGDRDARPGNEDVGKDRNIRERDSSRSDGPKGPVGGRRDAGGVSQSPSSSRIVSKLRGESTKEDSPSVMRGESSLAAVFDQTETTRAGSMGAGAAKKRPTKTFGGKKSPKKASEDAKNAEEKGRLRVGEKGGGLTTRGGRAAIDRSKEASQAVSKKITPSRDSLKDDAKATVKQESISKERASPASQKSADSHSKSSRRSSHSPLDGKRDAGGNAAVQDSKKSQLKSSLSPVPSPSPGGGSNATADAGRGRKKEEAKEGDSEKAKESERGNRKGRSETPSEAEVKTSPDLHERVRRKSSDSVESLPAKLDGGDIAAAMLGDGQEDGQQDVFSDWSDDDDPFNNIMDDGARKHHVEDLDHAHGFGFGMRGHSHREMRNRRGSPSVGDQAPDNLGLMHHDMDQMDHPSAGVGPGPGHHDGQGFGRSRDFHHHHQGGPAGRYFGGGSDVPPGGSQLGDSVAGGGGGATRGQAGPGRVDPSTRVDELLNKPALEKNIPDVKIVEDVQKEKPARERRRRNTGEEGYEEISSDENDLDEEGERIPKRTIVSILDIDMSSLMQIAKPSQSQSPSVSGRPAVFQRYKACSVFSQLGLSRHLLGEKLYSQVQEVCQKQLEQETAVTPGQA